MKRPPVTSTTRNFLDKNRTAVESAHRISLRQSQLARFLGWMTIALVLWSAGLMHMTELRLFVFFIFVIPGILIINGSAGGLRFATAALFATALIWFLWLRPAIAGTHPVAIQGFWISSGQPGFSLALYPLLHLTGCLVMAVICLVKSRINFFTVPVVIFWSLPGLGIGIPWRVAADRAARVRREFAAELAATKALLTDERFQDGPHSAFQENKGIGHRAVDSNHPQAVEMARLLDSNPRISHVYTRSAQFVNVVAVYAGRNKRGADYYDYQDWVRMPAGNWLEIEMRVYGSPAP